MYSVNTGTKQVTLVMPSDETSGVPESFVSGLEYDFIRGTPHFNVLAANHEATVASNVLTFTDDLPDDLAVGDFVALAGQTPIVNVPLEFQDVLVIKAVYSYLSGSGDTVKTPMAGERWKQAEKDVLALCMPRVSDTPQLVINYYGPGWGRGIRRRWR